MISSPIGNGVAIFERNSPPRAPLAFRVGVVGHRPNRLKEADLGQLAAVLNSILRIVKEEVAAIRRTDGWHFDDAPPVIRAVSPLAEGSDRLFAEQALELDYELCCVMPFPQAEFERDFASETASEDASLARFRSLTARASTRFELDGRRADPEGAYGAGGRTVLNQSDLLVVVWDGARQNKRGGTEETLDVARRRGLPVVWIDARAPHPWQVLDATTAAPTEGADLLRQRVRGALTLKSTITDPASSETTEDPAAGLKRFYDEGPHRSTAAVASPVPHVEKSVVKEWPADDASPVGRQVNRLRSFYAWPDRLAVAYSNLYRSSFILAFLLAAFAVGMALLPYATGMAHHELPERVCILLELSAITVILGLVILGRRQRWHQRWIEYRFVAESVRHLRLVAPQGGGRPFPQVPAHLATYGHPGATWMAWYVRAVERALGLPGVVVNNDYLVASLEHLGRVVDGQVRFHDARASRCRKIESRIHGTEILLLTLTLTSCGIHLAPYVVHEVHLPDWMSPLLTSLCAFFPALSAALAGILNQGEFRRIEMRSESMSHQLQAARREIDGLRSRIQQAGMSCEEQFSVRVSALAGDVAGLMLNEVLDWRVVFLDRPFEQPPG